MFCSNNISFNSAGAAATLTFGPSNDQNIIQPQSAPHTNFPPTYTVDLFVCLFGSCPSRRTARFEEKEQLVV